MSDLAPADKVTALVVDLQSGERVEFVNTTIAPGCVAYIGQALVREKDGKVGYRAGCFRLEEIHG